MDLDKEINFNKSIISTLTTYSKYSQELVNWTSCVKCNLCNTRTNVVFAGGDPVKSAITIIGEAPGPEENIKGIPFVGKTGTFLRTILDKVGFDAESLFWTNTVACEPKDFQTGPFRAPTSSEIKTCSPRLKWLLDNVIKNHKIIILLGKTSFIGLRSLIDNLDEAAISKLTHTFKVSDNLGWHKMSPELPVCYFTFHPSYIERTGREKLITQSWINDFKSIKEYVSSNVMNTFNNRKVIDYAKR